MLKTIDSKLIFLQDSIDEEWIEFDVLVPDS
jgi:hypothetical protein